MSLLQSEEFVIYQLRTGYLAQIQDGVGERLINVNTNFLNDVGYRAGGWSTNPPELKRVHSPPIPTAGASEYFKPPPAATIHRRASTPLDDEEDELEEGGLLTGRGSTDTVGPSLIARRRRRLEPVDEDDSSDLSDESNEETDITNHPGGNIRFSKMPERVRSGSSPLRGAYENEGPELTVTSPSRPPDRTRLRAGSLGAVEAVKARARGDTMTSSEMSSEGDLDPALFRRQRIRPSHSRSPVSDIREQPGEQADESSTRDERDDDDDSRRPSGETGNSLSDDDDLDSAFSEDVAGSLVMPRMLPTSTPSFARPTIAASTSPSPKKAKPLPTSLPALPPPRPISQLQPISALSQALKGKSRKSKNPLERFTGFAGSGTPNPLHLKILPLGKDGLEKPLEVVVRRLTDDKTPVSVADAIGFSLWRYAEERGSLARDKTSSNRWTLRIIDDDEVDYDFPALTRTRPISDFTSNNNRGTRGRSRDKPWDEFALVEATEAQFAENERLTPQFSDDITEEPAEDIASQNLPPPRFAATPTPAGAQSPSGPATNPVRPARSSSRPVVRLNPITDHRSALAAFRKDSTAALDVPEAAGSHATPRVGAVRTLSIRYTNADLQQQTVPIEATTDTYIAEVMDQICAKLALDKGLYVLRVTDTTTVAPTDRTVEALGQRSSLDLVRRRFVGEGYTGLSGSHGGSTSPNSPLLLTTASMPTKKGKRSGERAGPFVHPLAQQTDLLGLGSGIATSSTFRRFHVIRKQPMTFTPSNPRTLALDSEYMHIMPPDNQLTTGHNNPEASGAMTGHRGGGSTKTTTIHFSAVVGCKVNRKHPKTFTLRVFRERETKRYDFEARSVDEAALIVREIQRGVEPFRDDF